MKLKLPEDASITAWNEKVAAVTVWKRELVELTRTREKEREEFLIARRENVGALFSVDGRDLSRTAFEQKTQELDRRESELLKQIKKIEAELQELGRKRNRAIVAANRGAYLEILRRRACAVVEVAKANQDEIAFHDALRELDVSSLRPMLIKPVGEWGDSQSLARFHITELKKYFVELSNEDFEK